MDRPERKDTAQRALLYAAIAVAVVVILVLIWYAIDVVLLAFVGILVAILLRAPALWLAGHTGLRESWSLGLVGLAVVAILAGLGVLFGRGVAGEALQLVDRIPEIVATLKERLRENELGAHAVALAEASGLFSGGDGQFLGRGLGLLGSTFGLFANVVIVLFLRRSWPRSRANTSRASCFWLRAAGASACGKCSTRWAGCCAAGSSARG